MRRMNRWTLATPLIAVLALSAGCGTIDGDPVGDTIAVNQAPIASEQWGGVAEIVARYYDDSGIARRSYAVATISPGCSGTMIGPNILMTAAHCGMYDPGYATFRTYRNVNPFEPDTEIFTCHWLQTSWCDSDVLLYLCDPNAAGENPGDKYGYLDFDVSPVALNTEVYSVWRNPVDSLGIGDAFLYSQGKVLSNMDNGWYVARDSANGLWTDIYTAGGASGSSILRKSSGRIVALTSVGHPTGGPSRGSATMQNILYWGRSDVDGGGCGTYQPLNTARISALGLAPASYYGWVDKESNYLFDLQEGLERLRGENRRPWYWLGFESERRNALWGLGPSTRIELGSRWARVQKATSTSPELAISHARLNLIPGRTYRLVLSVATNSAGSSYALRAGFASGGVVNTSADIPTPAGVGWQMHVVTLTTPSAPAEFVLLLTAAFDGQIADISVIDDSAQNDFDTADKRYAWKNENTGAFASILPDGQTTGTPNWAGVVQRDFSRPAGNDWTLRNRQLGMVGGRWHRACFNARNASSSPTGNWGVLRVMSGTSEVVRYTFQPQNGGAWGGYCTGWFYTPSSDNNLAFGIGADVSGGVRYFVDDVSIQRW